MRDWCFDLMQIQRSFCEFSGNSWLYIFEEFLANRMMKMNVELKNFLRSKMMMQIQRISCEFSE